MIYKVSATYDNTNCCLFYFEYNGKITDIVKKQVEDFIDAMEYNSGYGLEIEAINMIDIFSKSANNLISAYKLHQVKLLQQFSELEQHKMEINSLRVSCKKY